VYQGDTLIHEFWMRRFRDPGLFQGELIEALVKTGYIPVGDQALLWLGSRFMDPVHTAELLSLVLFPFSAWLVFRIVRMHASWRGGPWIALALYCFSFDALKFSGGHSRAFMIPLVLTMVYLLMRGRAAWAAVVPPIGILLYPSAGALTLALFGASALTWKSGPRIDRGRLALAALAAVVTVVAFFTPRVVWDLSGDVISAAKARSLPEFGEEGQMHFFRDDPWSYFSSNYSGLYLRTSGSMLLIWVAGMALLRPGNVRMVRREVWLVPIVGLSLFVAAHLLLFRLYLPQRFVAPLVPILCILAGLWWVPTWRAVAARMGRWSDSAVAAALPAITFTVVAAFFGLVWFPLGYGLNLHAIPARIVQDRSLVIGTALVGLMVAVLAAKSPTRSREDAAGASAALVSVGLAVAFLSAIVPLNPTKHCEPTPLSRFLEQTPKSTLVAGHPRDTSCLPLTARRELLISRKLYQPWIEDYLAIIRPRMFDTIEAVYGASRRDILELRTKYGVDYLLVPERRQLGRPRLPGMEPFGDLARRLLKETKARDRPILFLPERCRVFPEEADNTVERLYDLACVADAW
jgi:hypothetical protein